MVACEASFARRRDFNSASRGSLACEWSMSLSMPLSECHLEGDDEPLDELPTSLPFKGECWTGNPFFFPGSGALLQMSTQPMECSHCGLQNLKMGVWALLGMTAGTISVRLRCTHPRTWGAGRGRG